MHNTTFTSTKDRGFGDCYFDISKTDDSLIRAPLKTYERRGTYVFLKLFKKTAEEYEFEQKSWLTLQEIGNLVSTAEKILQSVVQENSVKDCSTKLPANKRPKLQHESKDCGSNV